MMLALKRFLQSHREQRWSFRQVEFGQVKPSGGALRSTVFMKLNTALVFKIREAEQHLANEQHFVAGFPFMGIDVLHDERSTYYFNVNAQLLIELTYQR